ncbi:acyltransferase [Mycobacterium sp. EPG1]|nr:acyltransferase [Mycobacterium sp. EPG1]
MSSSARRRRSKSKLKPGQRLDIQGLRMVAVVLVMLDHIFGWPHGGFIGVDVFFVISGFLITGILLRDAEKFGHVSFIEFYRRRIRRIVPAATLTLAAIAGTAWLMFSPIRAKEVWWDSLSAFFFTSNWRFAVTGTDYFTADGAISPVRHFWSLSVEEQFYFVWPAVMAGIVFITARRAMSTTARHRIAGAIMAALIIASYSWAVIDTADNPTWSYFSTLTRIWELGAGALLAIFATNMSKIPDRIRPPIAWIGLALIMFGAFWITEDKGFPGPWAIIPVTGSALVLLAGTGGPARFLWPLTNKASVLVGDLSYSLYLWHWPVIIFLGSWMEATGWQFYLAATTLSIGLATLAYYYVEQPILQSGWLKPRAQQEWRSSYRRSRKWSKTLRRNLRARFTFEVTQGRQVAAVVGLALLTVGSLPLLTAPRDVPTYISIASLDTPAEKQDDRPLPPQQAELQAQVRDAVRAQKWPALNPTIEAVISGPRVDPKVWPCSAVTKDCWFGETSAPQTIVLVGDSIAMTYLAPLVSFVESSGGQWKLLNQASNGCQFINIDVHTEVDAIAAGCPGRKQRAVDFINKMRPDVVLIANHYGKMLNRASEPISEQAIRVGLQEQIAQFAGSPQRIAFLTAPPEDKNPSICYRPDGSPGDCVGRVTPMFFDRLQIEQSIAEGLGNAEVIDTRLLFCTPSAYCPMFVGTTPMKMDGRHISPEYAQLMVPGFTELLNGTTTFAP